MTSEQVLLITAVLTLTLTGCNTSRSSEELVGTLRPYESRRVWAIVPLRNESGSLHANGLGVADQLASQFEMSSNVDVLPVNRTLAAMDFLQMKSGPSSPAQVRQLMRSLNCDGIIVGSITAYDPYDPPKLGLALELYVDETSGGGDVTDMRALVGASTSMSAAQPKLNEQKPASLTSAYFDAADGEVRQLLEAYASDRGPRDEREATTHLHRINMDLFSRFVSHVMSRRLLRAELHRVQQPVLASVPDR